MGRPNRSRRQPRHRTSSSHWWSTVRCRSGPARGDTSPATPNRSPHRIPGCSTPRRGTAQTSTGCCTGATCGVSPPRDVRACETRTTLSVPAESAPAGARPLAWAGCRRPSPPRTRSHARRGLHLRSANPRGETRRSGQAPVRICARARHPLPRRYWWCDRAYHTPHRPPAPGERALHQRRSWQVPRRLQQAIPTPIERVEHALPLGTQVRRVRVPASALEKRLQEALLRFDPQTPCAARRFEPV